MDLSPSPLAPALAPGTLGHGQVRAASLAAVLYQAISVPEVLQALQLAAAHRAAATHALDVER